MSENAYDELKPTDRKDRIQILLAEYATLRAELIQRSTWQIQMLTVGGSAFVVILGFLMPGNQVMGGTLLLLVWAVVIICGLRYNIVEGNPVIDHVCLLELRINKIAGESLLTWENTRGMRSLGYIGRLKRFIGSFKSLA